MGSLTRRDRLPSGYSEDTLGLREKRAQVRDDSGISPHWRSTFALHGNSGNAVLSAGKCSFAKFSSSSFGTMYGQRRTVFHRQRTTRDFVPNPSNVVWNERGLKSRSLENVCSSLALERSVKIAISPLSHRALSAIRADQNHQRRKRKPCPHEEPKTTIAEIKACTGMDLRIQTRASHSIDDENTDGVFNTRAALRNVLVKGKRRLLRGKRTCVVRFRTRIILLMLGQSALRKICCKVAK